MYDQAIPEHISNYLFNPNLGGAGVILPPPLLVYP